MSHPSKLGSRRKFIMGAAGAAGATALGVKTLSANGLVPPDATGVFAPERILSYGAHRLLAGLGPEPLGNDFHEVHLVAALRGRRSPVKAMLLDQRIVAGLGNIYVCEALFRTGISPVRQAGRISARRVASLVPAIRQVLTDAIDAGGSSLRDYRQADGELGYFQHSFDVYGREGAPCRTPGCTSVIARTVQSGRSSFYCPTCQR